MTHTNAVLLIAAIVDAILIVIIWAMANIDVALLEERARRLYEQESAEDTIDAYHSRR